MDDVIGHFHFLRPYWLLAIPLAIWFHLRLRRRFDAHLKWRGVIAPDLLEHLVVSGKTHARIRPYQVLTVVSVLAAVALAGPTWEREPSPFAEDRAPLVVALELTPTMLATDQPPTRLARAKQKLRDLLEQRRGARTAVIAYAGSAHVVLPLTEDANLIEVYLESLAPSLMPTEGDRADEALRVAASILASDETAGTILFLTDGIERTYSTAFADHGAASQDQILILGFGSEDGGPIAEGAKASSDFGLIDGRAPGIDLDGLRAAADAAGGSVLVSSVDRNDVEVLTTRIRNRFTDRLQDDDRQQWRDFGYVMVWPLALLMLLWARRGWTVV